MERMKKSIVIDASVEEIFDYLGDPTSNQEIMPSMVEVQGMDGEGVGAKYRWVYRMAGMSFEGESTVVEFVPGERFVTQSRGQCRKHLDLGLCAREWRDTDRSGGRVHGPFPRAGQIRRSTGGQAEREGAGPRSGQN